MKFFTLFSLLALLYNFQTIAQNPQLVEGIRVSEVDGKMQADSLLTSAKLYDRSGKLLTDLELIEEPNMYYLEKTYNPFSQLIKEEKRNPDGSSIEEIRFAYDYKGDLVRKEIYRRGGDSLIQSVYHLYGPENLLVKRVFSSEDDSENNHYETFTYDQQNRVIHSYFYIGRQLNQEEAFSYNEDNQLSEQAITYQHFSVRYSYAYKRGDLYEVRKYVNGRLNSVSSYERDKKGKLRYVLITYPDLDKRDFLYFMTKIPTQPIQEELSRGSIDTTTAEKP